MYKKLSFLIILLITCLPVSAFWSNIKEKDKSLCRDKAVEAKNDFIAKKIYQNCIKELKEDNKKKKKEEKKLDNYCEKVIKENNWDKRIINEAAEFKKYSDSRKY